MPQKVINVPAELFLRYKHIKIYCTYKNDDVSHCAYMYHFVLDEFGLVDDAFDVRDIKDWVDSSKHSNIPKTEYVRKFLIKCIDDGRFNNHVKNNMKPWEFS